MLRALEEKREAMIPVIDILLLSVEYVSLMCHGN